MNIFHGDPRSTPHGPIPQSGGRDPQVQRIDAYASDYTETV